MQHDRWAAILPHKTVKTVVDDALRMVALLLRQLSCQSNMVVVNQIAKHVT